MRTLSVLSILVTVALTFSATAGHCTTWSTNEADLTTCIGGVEPCFHYDNDTCQPECPMDIWIYQESNGIPGLQRADEFQDDTCHGMIEGDSIIF